MFTTPKVPAFIQNFKGAGDEDEKSMKLTLYVYPISYDLASEVSPKLADRLFRKNGGEWSPAPEMPRAQFNIGEIPPQRVTFYPHTEELADIYGVLVENVKISGIQACKPYAEKNDYRLEFDATMSMDKLTLGVLERFYKTTVFITTEESQPTLFDQQSDPVMDLHCLLCDSPNPEWATIDNKRAYCDKDKHNKADDDVLKRIRDTATATVIVESMGREPGGDEPPEHKDPLLSDAEETAAYANSKKRRKKTTA